MRKPSAFGIVLCILSALSTLGTPTLVHSAGEKVLYVPGSTQKVCQLTGEFDFDPLFRQRTLNHTDSNVGIKGTDLGFSFEHRAKNSILGGSQRAMFLFGDTVGKLEINLDSLAYSEDLNPDDCIQLQFVTQPADSSTYRPPMVSGYPPQALPPITHSTLGVPSHGFSANQCPDGSEKIYVFFSSFSDATVTNPLRSLLAYSCDAGQSFQYLYDFSKQFFINGSSVIVDSAEIPGLPQISGHGLLLWGSGKYRQSDVYLAFVPLDQVEDRAAWRYFCDTLHCPGEDRWVTEESRATSVLTSSRSQQNPTPCVGELSVTWNPFLNKWLLLYNCNALDTPSQIRFHVADLPWGPWSDFVPSGPGGSTTILFEPVRDKAYGRFMHEADVEDGLDDNIFDDPKPPGRLHVRGDPYAPYVISRFTTGDARGTTIYYTMSTWNPYQVMLMKSTLRLERPPVATPINYLLLDEGGSPNKDLTPIYYLTL